MTRSALCASLAIATCLNPIASAGDAEAERQFARVIDAYRTADILVDEMNYTVHMPGAEPHKDGFTIVFGPDDLVGVNFGSLLAVAQDKRLYFAGADADDPYLESPLTGSFDDTLQNLLGGATRIPAPPHVFMRDGSSIDEVISSFGFGLVGSPELVAVDTVETDDAQWLLFTAENQQAQLRLFVNPATRFVDHMTLEAAAGPSPDQGRITAEIKFHPTADPATNSIRAFTTDGRMRVSSINDLMRVGPDVGAAAPDLFFQRPGGDQFTLADLRGRIVVLDFWATWCGNCFISLPQLQKVADWAEAENLDVEFLCVNSQEEIEDEQLRIQAATTWWNNLKLDLPWVIDVNNNASIALRASSFPALIIIDADGVIAYAHSGFDKDLGEHVRAKLTELSKAY